MKSSVVEKLTTSSKVIELIQEMTIDKSKETVNPNDKIYCDIKSIYVGMRTTKLLKNSKEKEVNISRFLLYCRLAVVLILNKII